MPARPTSDAGDAKRTKRDRTREELRRCALARFARDGFDNANVADIAAAAGVTERTFYRHFPTKESVLFEDFASRLGWFRAALAVRPRSEPLLDSVRVAIQSYPDDREVVRQVAQARGSMLSSRVIELQLRAIQADFAHEIARVAAERMPRSRGRDLAARVVGEAVAGALVSSLRVWGEQDAQDTDALQRIVEDGLAVLRRMPALV